MPDLLAVAPDGGWAYAGRGDELPLVRPPYDSRPPLPVDEFVLVSAVTKHGYVAEDAPFPDWADLLAHLRDQIQRRRQDMPRAEEVAKGHWNAASVEALTRTLGRVGDHVIPDERYDDAQRLLIAMMQHSPSLQRSLELMPPAAKLLAEAAEHKGAAERELTRPAAGTMPWPLRATGRC